MSSKRDVLSRSRLPGLSAGLALFACVALALACAAPAAAAPVTFGSGQLDWGVKESFRNYIVGPIAQGSYTASDGAAKLSEPNGVVRFDVLGGPYDDATGVGELLIDGTVHFAGHHGALDMTVKNIRLALAGGSGTLYADVMSKDLDTGTLEQYPNIELADLGPVAPPTPTTGGLTWGSIPVVLTEAGAPAFGDFYAAGDDLDPLAPLVADYDTPRPRPDRGGDGGGGDGGGGGGTGGGTGGGGTGTGTGTGSPTPPPSAPASPTVSAVAKVSGVAKPVTLGAGRVAKIATLRCGAARCKVTAPKSVKIKIKRKRYSVGVLAPKSLEAGKSGKLRVRLSKAARNALAGRRTTVKVNVAIAADGRKTTKTVKATLKAKPAKAR